jgi:hypothetical protein
MGRGLWEESMTREEWKLIEDKLASDHETRQTHAGRCEEQGHQWDDCMTPFFAVYQQCKWCGERSDPPR